MRNETLIKSINEITDKAITLKKEYDKLRAVLPSNHKERAAHQLKIDDDKHMLNQLSSQLNDKKILINRIEKSFKGTVVSLEKKRDQVNEIAIYVECAKNTFNAIADCFADLKNRRRAISANEIILKVSNSRDILVSLAKYRDELKEFSVDRTRVESMRIMAVEVSGKLDEIIRISWASELGDRP